MADMDKEEVLEILKRANLFELEKNFKSNAKGKILGNLFFEPSTRTRMSFETAMLKLGGGVINFSEKLSSIEKGENFEDTIRVVDLYCDIIVLRHQKDGAARFASEISQHPVINAGDGSNQHPTQALLDLYTIKKLKKNFKNLNVALVGDLKYGRTIHSLIYGLAMFECNITLISPKDLRMPSYIIDDVQEKFNVSIEEKENLDKKYDVLYVTRIQKERFADPEEYEYVKDAYKITKENLSENTIVMHPLPRLNEIDREIDKTKNAVYFLQAKNGIFVRMAIIDYLLENS